MGTHRTVVFLGITTGFLTAVCIALAAVLIWREVADTTTEQEDPSLVSLNTTNATEIRLKFPGYFKTPREAEILLMANPNTPQPVLNVSRVFTRCFFNGYCERRPEIANITRSPILERLTTTQQPTEGRRRRRAIDIAPLCSLDDDDVDELTFHGCCVSRSDLETPSVLATAEPGQTGDVQLAQFGQLNQYFEIQECCQARDCDGCQCSQTFYVTQAVVVRSTKNGPRFTTEYVRVPGCCKCLNIEQVVENRQDEGSRQK